MREMLHRICEMVEDELDQIAEGGELSAANLQTIDMLTHTLKSVKTIMAMEDSDYKGGYYSRREGRYISSRDDGKDRMISRIERIRDMATSEAEKEALHKAIQVIEGQR